MTHFKLGERVICPNGMTGRLSIDPYHENVAQVSLDGNVGTLYCSFESLTREKYKHYNVEDGPEVDILKALSHKQISLNTAIEVLGGIKWDRNNTIKRGEKNV